MRHVDVGHVEFRECGGLLDGQLDTTDQARTAP